MHIFREIKRKAAFVYPHTNLSDALHCYPRMNLRSPDRRPSLALSWHTDQLVINYLSFLLHEISLFHLDSSRIFLLNTEFSIYRRLGGSCFVLFCFL